jgi:hypothetical protein
LFEELRTNVKCMTIRGHARQIRRSIILLTIASSASAQSLANRHVRADFGARGMTALTDAATRRSWRLESDAFAISINGRAFESTTLGIPERRVEANRITYRYRAGDLRLLLTYELRGDWGFVSKQVALVSGQPDSFRVDSVALFRSRFNESPADVYLPPSARSNLQTGVYGAALRFGDANSLLMVAQNPFLRFTRNGAAVSLSYSPDMEWRSAYGEFVSDRGLIAPVRLSGERLPARMIPEWHEHAANSSPGLDRAEVEAFTSMVRAFLLYRPDNPINVFVGWCANDYQIDTGTPEGRAEYRRLLDQAANVGAQYVLYAPSNSALSRREESVDDWSWEHVLWLGLGQKIRKGEWDPAASQLPPSVQEMLDYARGKGLRFLAYVYPVLPFTQNPQWLVPSRSDPRRQAASLGNRALQDWLIEQLVAFHGRTGIAGYAFDHTFLTYAGTSRYAQWYGWRRVMEELRRRIPDVVIDGRQAYHLYGPWSWLAGSYPHPTFNDEQPESFVPYPDLHFDRASANRERYTAWYYRNYEFAPAELVPGFMMHQTSRSADDDQMPSTRTSDRGVILTSFRARDWDYLGWRYSVLSSIAVGGWNNVINMIPARDSAENAAFSVEDRDWLRGWLRWSSENKEYLRRTRTILDQPALGKVDGTSAILGDRGFVFLFNPDARRLTARFRLDASIGLTGVGRFELRELHPLVGRLLGKPVEATWAAGDEVTLDLDGGSALVLEITPAPVRVTAPRLFNAPGSASLREGTLELADVRGAVGTESRLLVRLPAGTPVDRISVNGTNVPPAERRSDVIAVDVRFAGAPVRQLQPVLVTDSAFNARRVSGTLTVPRSIFDQLAARRIAWPIPWTAEDFRTTWLVPERLLLFAQFGEPDDRWEARLTIDGRAVELRKAYSAVRVVPRTFVGFYADLTLLEPDRAYRFELELPPGLRPGQFRGLFFENVETEYTTSITRRP